MRLKQSAMCIGVTLFLCGSAGAVDLPQSGMAQCSGFHDSTLLSYAPVETKKIVSQYFSEARAAMSNPAIVGSRRPAYTWATGTRLACGAALGYLTGGHIDKEALQKCDCFYQRFNSFR